jgi:hypothetical protein
MILHINNYFKLKIKIKKTDPAEGEKKKQSRSNSPLTKTNRPLQI